MLPAEAHDRGVYLKAEGCSTHGEDRKGRRPTKGPQAVSI
jgi:hypothetical protein